VQAEWQLPCQMIDEVSARKISEFPKVELRRFTSVPVSEIESFSRRLHSRD
jgi:hypothetical protein